MRSCDCFGVQDVHIIENRNEYQVIRDVALGSTQWLNLYKYNEKEFNTLDCYEKLRKDGYRIIATTPHEKDTTIEELPVDTGKMALVFGTELEGLSPQAISQADEFVKIPIHGFTESLNISVTAALSLFHLTTKIRKSNVDWKLSDEESVDIRIEWAKRVLKNPDLIIKRFFEQIET